MRVNNTHVQQTWCDTNSDRRPRWAAGLGRSGKNLAHAEDTLHKAVARCKDVTWTTAHTCHIIVNIPLIFAHAILFEYTYIYKTI